MHSRRHMTPGHKLATPRIVEGEGAASVAPSPGSVPPTYRARYQQPLRSGCVFSEQLPGLRWGLVHCIRHGADVSYLGVCDDHAVELDEDRPDPRQAAHVIDVGRRVDLVFTGGSRLSGLMVGRFTYPDETIGAVVELDQGAAVCLPIGELVPEGVTV